MDTIGGGDRRVCVIAAMADDRVAGSDTGIPWHFSDDLTRFVNLTWGHSIVMGRRTWETLPGPLPGRQSIVLTRHRDTLGYQVTTAPSLSEGIERASLPPPVFVIGGRRPWIEAIPTASRVYLTRIYESFEGTVYFPQLDPDDWEEIERASGTGLVNGRLSRYEFLVYDRMRVVR